MTTEDLRPSDTDFGILLPTFKLPPKPEALEILILPPGVRRDLWQQYFLARGEAFGKYERLPSGIDREIDGYDPYSFAILATLGNRLVGGCRLVDSQQTTVPFLTCPESASFKDQIPIDMPHFEISRMLLSQGLAHRAIRDEVMYQLCSAIAFFAFEVKGYPYLYSDMIMPFYRAIARVYGDYLMKLAEAREVGKPGQTLTLVPVMIAAPNVEAMRVLHLAKLEAQRKRLEIAGIPTDGARWLEAMRSPPRVVE